MMSLLNTEQIDNLKLALANKAITSTGDNQRAALRIKVAHAFRQELNEIDPAFAKTAGWRDFLKNNWLDIALTAGMFVPGLNVAAGLGRAGLAAYRAGNAGYRAYRAINAGRTATQVARAANAARGVAVPAVKGARTVGRAVASGARAGTTGLRSVGGATRHALREAKRGFGRARSNPFNNAQGFFGSKGTSWTGKRLNPNAVAQGGRLRQAWTTLRQGGRSSLSGQGQAWRNLSRGQKAGRGALVGLGMADAGFAGYGATKLYNRAMNPPAAQTRAGGTGSASRLAAMRGNRYGRV